MYAIRSYYEQRHRQQEVQGDHGPERNRIGARELEHHHVELRWFASEESGQVLGEGEVEPDDGHHQQKLGQIREVNRLQVALQMIGTSEDDHDDQQGCDARKDRPRNEVRTENRAVP